MKKIAFIAAISLAVALAWSIRRKGTDLKPNVLIFSHCSLRWDFLSPWGGNPEWAPNIHRFAQDALVVKNAVSDRSWSNVAGFIKSISKEEFASWGYSLAGEPWDDFLVKPMALDPSSLPPLFYQKLPRRELPNRDSNFHSDLAALEAKMNSLRDRPFFLEVHSKFMHLPWGLSGDVGKSADGLTERSRNLWLQYTKAPGSYLKRLPMLILLSPPGRIFLEARRHPLVASAIRAKTFHPDDPIVNWIGWLQDPRVFDEWRRQPDWEADVALLREMYVRRLKAYDALIGPVLNLWGNRDLQENTVVIFTGDHGESFGERAGLAHGEEVSEELIRFPLMVKFPGGKVVGSVDRQIYQAVVRDLAKGIMSGQVGPHDVKKFLEARAGDDLVFVRDCSGVKAALRWKNEWKLVHNEAEGTWKLFSLSGENSELVDVADRYPEVFSRMREMMLTEPRQEPNPMGESCGLLRE